MLNRFSVLIFFVFTSVLCVQAQTPVTTSAAVNPGGFIIKGGVNFANISTYNDGSYNDANTLTTYNVGVLFDLPVAGLLSIQPGIVYTGKGSEASGTVLGVASTTKFNPMYLEVPVNMLVKIPLGLDSRLFIGAGPYGAVGVGGKWKNTTTAGGIETKSSKDIEFGSSGSDDLKMFDYGVNGLAGLELGNLVLGVNYGLGLAKIFPGQNNNNANDKNKYRVLSLNLGVRL